MRQAARRKHVSLCRIGDTNKEPYMTDIYLPTYMVLFLLLFYESDIPLKSFRPFPETARTFS